MQHVPPSPKAMLPPSSPTARAGHLQPLDTGSTSMRASLNSGQRSILAGKTNGGAPPMTAAGSRAEREPHADADNIKVVVRVRPLFPHEEAKGAANVVAVAEDFSSLKVVVTGPGGNTMQRDFAFHACLPPATTQGEVMQLCGINQLLDAALAGYHVTILAYGQTGSGKTHTMSGVEDVISDDLYTGDARDGIVSRAAQYLFHQVNTRKDAKYGVKASYVEIYNEQVYDLIHFHPKQGKSLPVKWDASYGFYVQGLKVVPCSQMKTLMEVLRTGMKNRKVGSHQLNMESSRSHSILTIYCDASPTDPSSYDYGTMRYGKLSFVDLAGSERVKDSHSEGTMLRETININKSLSALGKVISVLAERDSGGSVAHVPYRDSKLTKLLMDSLGGNALTLMIACCSPSSLQVEETLSTLSYATRAKNIHNQPMVCYDPKEAQISLLRREIELLRQENSLLREQLRHGGPPRSPSLPLSPAGSPLSPGNPRAPSPLLSPLPGPALLNAGYSAGPGGSPLGPGALGAYSGPPHLQHQPAVSSGGVSESGGGGVGQEGAPGGPGRMPSADRGITRNGGRPSGTLSPVPPQTAGGAAAAAVAAAAAAAGGNPAMAQDMLRRLKDTQTLLIKFSEENQRLARENDKLRGSKNVLGVQHANVLDEIDMLRGKLLQLEQSVLTAAGPPGAPGDSNAAAQAAVATAVAAAQVRAATAGGPALVTEQGRIDVKALLASLGLGEGATADLPGMGVGHTHTWGAEALDEPGEGASTPTSNSGSSSMRSSLSRVGTTSSAAGGGAAGGGSGGSPTNSTQGAYLGMMSSTGGDSLRQASPLRPVMSPVRGMSSNSQLSSGAAAGGGGGGGAGSPSLLATGGIAAAAKTVIGRATPGSAGRIQPWAEASSDHRDSITVTDASKLAVLFTPPPPGTAAAAAAGVGEQGPASKLARPPSLGPGGTQQQQQQHPHLAAIAAGGKAVSFRGPPPP